MEEEEEEEDVEDIGGVGGTPSSSTANLESDDSLDDVVPLGQASVSHSVSGDFSRPSRNLDVLDFDHLNISERPSSVPTSPGGSSSKRRRVASADARSPLGRPAAVSRKRSKSRNAVGSRWRGDWQPVRTSSRLFKRSAMQRQDSKTMLRRECTKR